MLFSVILAHECSNSTPIIGQVINGKVVDMVNEQRPNEKEIEALSLFYNRFYSLYDEIVDEGLVIKTRL